MEPLELKSLSDACQAAIRLLLRSGFADDFLQPIARQAAEAFARGDAKYMRRLAHELKAYAPDLSPDARAELKAILDGGAEDSSDAGVVGRVLARGEIRGLREFRAVSDFVDRTFEQGHTRGCDIEALNILLAKFVGRRDSCRPGEGR